MHIVIATTATLAPMVTDLRESAERLGLDVEVQEQEPGAFASMPWWLPTGVVLQPARGYFEAMAVEPGRDKYPMVKQAFLRLFKRLAGESREVKLMPTTSSAGATKVNGPEYDALSAMVELCSGHRAKFLIPCDMPAANHEAAI